MIKFTNTMGGTKQEFMPVEKDTVRIYTCGPTVYSYATVGNFRSFCFADILRRHLKFRGYNVIQVMNITDVEDKIIRDSKKEGLSIQEFTEKYTAAFLEDLETLGIEKVEYYPRATQHIPEMIDMVKKLQENGLTYSKGGSTYFSISKFEGYGKLSNLDKRTIKVGARIDADEYEKEDARDFVLWKAHKEDEPSWDSPFGPGRPGWHLECSVMSSKYLGTPFDIHTGGVDLIFPHHENEIAQSEGAFGRQFVKYWLHNDYLLMESEKMSKSKGNIATVKEIMDQGYNPKVIRHLLISTHYRKQLNFSKKGLNASEETLKRLWDFLDRLEEPVPNRPDNDNITNLVNKTRQVFTNAMDDDLNIAEAMAGIHVMVREVNTAIDQGSVSRNNLFEVKMFMKMIDQVLNILHREKGTLDEEIETMIQEREQARKQKDYQRADEIRDKLKSKGIILEDTPTGVRWKKV